MDQLLTKVFFLKFIKFGFVGASGMVIDFSITYFFKEIVKIEKYVANAIGFTIAAISNYFLNRIWTFESLNPDIPFEFIKFFIVSLIGLGINTLILFILVSKYKKNFYLSKLFAVGVVMFWNFFVNWIYTFS
jgi:putative flippase GtrA